jgi:uncharacterized protein YlxW (UPF0749 family)
MPPTPDSWDTWSKHVRAELERLNDRSENFYKEVAAIYREIASINAQLATLKMQAGLWGAVGAAIPVVVMLAVQNIR